MNENPLITEQLAVIPNELRQFILSNAWAASVALISTKNNFSSEQSATLENEVLFVLSGLEFKGDVQKNIREQLNIPDILAHDIADEINENIFRQVNDFLPSEAEEDEKVTEPIRSNGPELIEDAEGNKDNVITLPTIDNQQPVANQLPQSGNDQQTMTVDQKLNALTANSNAENKIVQKQYSDKPDPYREPPTN